MSLKLFLERTGFPADDISSRVAWKSRAGAKVQNMWGVRERAGVAMNAKQEEIKRIYSPLIPNEISF